MFSMVMLTVMVSHTIMDSNVKHLIGCGLVDCDFTVLSLILNLTLILTLVPLFSSSE